jgi:hypothetical protein
VNVRTGRFAYFDSAEIAIRPEHVMAIGSLPQLAALTTTPWRGAKRRSN